MDMNAHHLQGVFIQFYSTLEMSEIYMAGQALARPRAGMEEEEEGIEGMPAIINADGNAAGGAPAEHTTPGFLLVGLSQCHNCGHHFQAATLAAHAETCVLQQDHLLEHQNEEEERVPGTGQIDIRNLQRRSKRVILNKNIIVQQAFLATLQSDPRRHGHAIQFMSQAHAGSGKLFANSYRQTERQVVEDQVYRAALEQRVLCDVGGRPATEVVLWDGPRSHCKCQLDMENPQDIRRFPSHGASCQKLGAMKISRHNNIRDLLGALLRKQSVEENGRVTVEHRDVIARAPAEEHGDVIGRAPQKRPDIIYEARGVTKHIDVMVVDPLAERYQRGVHHPGQEAGGAAIQGELRKRQGYEGTIYVETLVPFVLESTGRFGPAAERFVREYGGSAASQAAFKKSISTTLAIWEGKTRVSMLKNLLTEDEFMVKRRLREAARHPIQG
jgi:hypothetical protein